MRSVAYVLSAVLLAGCVVYEPARTVRTAAPAAPRVISQGEAVRRAFDVCDERGLDMDRVHHAALDAEGWKIELRGPTGDRAKLLLDAESGRLLKGRFRDGASASAPAEDDPPPPPPPSPDGAGPARVD
jgi:hypothetical protein